MRLSDNFGTQGAIRIHVPICATPARLGRKQQPITNKNKMQNYCKTIGALAAASALAAGNASAIELEYELHAGYTSEYLFRGIILGDDLVEAGFDVATEAGGFGLSAGAWYGSFNRTVGANSPLAGIDADFNELDLYGEVSRDLGFATLAVGYIYYMNSDVTAFDPWGNRQSFGFDDAQEVYFSLGRDFGGLETSLTYFWDVETDNDGYMELAASYGWELSSCVTLNVGGGLGYLCEEGDFAHLTTKVALDYAFTETATVSPFLAYALSLEDGSAIYTGTQNEFVGGAMLSVSF
jgi:uncharacterized protein (TIGR02001 family)